MNMKSIFAAALLATSALTGLAHAATTWTWQEQGTISNGYDGFGLFGTAGQDLAGKQFTKIFTVSVDPVDYSYVTNGGYYIDMYGSDSLLVNTSITIDGITVNESFNSDSYNEQIIEAAASLGSFDQIISNNSGTDSSGNYVSMYDYAYSSSHLFVPSLDFTQLITASGSDVHTYSDFYLDNGSSYTSFSGTPDTITVNATNVPEPASLALLGLGFAGMGVLRRRKAK